MTGDKGQSSLRCGMSQLVTEGRAVCLNTNHLGNIKFETWAQLYCDDLVLLSPCIRAMELMPRTLVPIKMLVFSLTTLHILCQTLSFSTISKEPPLF